MNETLAEDSAESVRETELLLIHGGFHGAWVWEKVLECIEPLGWRVHTVELPSVAGVSDVRYGIHDDAAEVRRRIEAIDGPVVVVAHSYGGVVITQAATGLANVSHIVFLAALQLDIGESVLDLVDEPPPWWNIAGDTITVDRPLEIFYHDVPRDDALRAVDRLRPSSYAMVTQRLKSMASQDIPSTYVICEQDRALPPSVQEHLAKRATNIRRLPSSHSPMLSRPGELVRIIAEVGRFPR
ncbi:alpha/beta fold hydrolase [Mycobacterium sp. URHB0021]|jgi:pimeloyl-ACP methyl ester carboxylesterase